MPGLIAFRRRWSVGSDDLVVPAVILFLVHFIWAIILTITLAAFPDSVPECGVLLFQHLIGYTAIFGFSLVLEIMIMLIAVRGSILDTDKRMVITKLLYIRLGVLGLEVVWLVLGVAWLCIYYPICPEVDGSKGTLLGLVICSGVIALSFIVTLWCTFDPAGRSWVKMMNYQRSMKQSESRFQYRRSGSCTRTWRQRKVLRAYQDSWDHRCRLLFCCMRHSDRSQNSFADIARLLSDFFRDIDVVPSDVVAGLVLLRKYQKVERESILQRRVNDTYEYLSGVAVTSGTEFLTLHDPVHYQFFQDVIYYMHLAIGAYGWPFYVMNNSVATACSLCSSLRCSCFPCCRSKDDSAVIIKDNCCMCNYTALQQIVAAHDVDLVYATFHVDVGITPFFVAVDYKRQKIIISIRGTLSLKDVLTDLNAEGEPIPINPPKDDWLGHKGMVQVAVHILDKLMTEKILDQAFSWNIARGTSAFKIVTVGHSLGAGAAAILAILLRDSYPDVLCFSYSPPGGTLSLPAAEYTKRFVTSVVVGKDVVPRIGLHQMESLRADLMHAIKRSKDPKWKTISCSVVCCGCAVLPTSAAELRADDFLQQEYQQEKLKVREVFKSQNSNATRQPLYPPGRIIHVVRHHTKKEEQRYENRWRQMVQKRSPVYQALWANNTDFDEVLISPVMIQDHMPDQVLAALEKVITTVGPRKPQRKSLAVPNESLGPENELSYLLDSQVAPEALMVSPGSPSTHTPPHKLQLETSFTSLLSPGEKTHKLSLQSFGSHSSNSNTITSSLLKTDSLKKPEVTSPHVTNFIPWEYQSLLEDQKDNSSNSKPDSQKIDLIHDEWFGLAPLATPESLSEVSSISSRASSMIMHCEKTRHKRINSNGFRKEVDTGLCEKSKVENGDLLRPPTLDKFKGVLSQDCKRESPEPEIVCQFSPRVIRRTLKFSNGLSDADQDVTSNLRFEAMMKSVDFHDCASNETNSFTSAQSHETEQYASAKSSSGESVTLRQERFYDCNDATFLNYHKPTLVILPDDDKFPFDHGPDSYPYLETDFSVSDPELNLINTNSKKLEKKTKAKFQHGVSFDQDYEFDIETESSKLLDSQNESENSLLFANTCKSLQTQDSCFRDEDSIEECLRKKDVSPKSCTSGGSDNFSTRVPYGSRSVEALPLLSSLNPEPSSQRKRKYSFSILPVGKGESSV